jgi:hypothetical protein
MFRDKLSSITAGACRVALDLARFTSVKSSELEV